MIPLPGKNIFLIFFIILTLFSGARAQEGMIEGQVPGYQQLFEGFVYYSDPGKTALKSVKKKFASSLDMHKLGIQILETLIAGPSDASLVPTWPTDTQLNSFFISDDGSAYVDLNINALATANMDTTSEYLAIYSMVNSLTLNIAKIRQVKILIQGKDAHTLAGHIGLEHFYKANMLIVK